MRILLSVVLLAILLLGCDNGRYNMTKVYGVEIETYSIDSTLYLTNLANSPKCELSISMQYMKGKNANQMNHAVVQSGILLTNDTARPHAEVNIRQAVNRFVHQYMNDYKSENSLLYKGDANHPTAYHNKYKLWTEIQNNKAGVLTYIIKLMTAHGDNTVSNQTIVKNFDLNTGTLITLSDLFIEGYEASVMDCIIDKLTKRYKAKDIAELKQKGFFIDVQPYISHNYMIRNNEMTFIYNEDEIAPHHFGEIAVDINHSHLNKYLK